MLGGRLGSVAKDAQTWQLVLPWTEGGMETAILYPTSIGFTACPHLGAGRRGRRLPRLQRLPPLRNSRASARGSTSSRAPRPCRMWTRPSRSCGAPSPSAATPARMLSAIYARTPRS